MKHLLIFVLFAVTFSCSNAQKKSENITIAWPIEYKWQIVNQSEQENQSSLTIIPGNETVEKATIIGVMNGYRGVKISTPTEIVAFFKQGLDTGSVLTILQRDSSTKTPWVIFKVETPKTNKYPEPESDLYYCIQGSYALFDNHVAIKEDKLTPEFEKKWIKIFKEAKLTK